MNEEHIVYYLTQDNYSAKQVKSLMETAYRKGKAKAKMNVDIAEQVRGKEKMPKSEKTGKMFVKQTYLADRCKKCKKLRANDVYFCSGCGYGKFEDLENAWEEVNLIEI